MDHVPEVPNFNQSSEQLFDERSYGPSPRCRSVAESGEALALRNGRNFSGVSAFAQGADELANRLAPKIASLIMESINAPKVSPRWLDLEQAAILMSTTKDAVRGMARAKLFPVHKMGSRVMIDVRDLEKAFAENTVWLQ